MTNFETFMSLALPKDGFTGDGSAAAFLLDPSSLPPPFEVEDFKSSGSGFEELRLKNGLILSKCRLLFVHET